MPGKASHVDGTCQRAFFSLIAIFKRIEEKYLADEEFFGLASSGYHKPPRCRVSGLLNAAATVAQRRSGIFDTPRL